jgi:hypothetical protein
MAHKLVSGFLLAGVASYALISAANADVQIRMKPGEQCWSYRGRDTRFFGDFAGEQSLTIAFVIQDANDRGGITTSAYNGDAVWVNGPDGYYHDGNEAVWADDPEQDYPMSNPKASISTEKPGRYIFNLAEHGSGSNLPVFFQICALRNKD